MALTTECVAHACDTGSRGAPVHHVVPSLAAVCLGRLGAGTASAKCTLAAAVQPGTLHPASHSPASALQKGIAEGKCSRALQMGTAEDFCKRVLQKGSLNGKPRRAVESNEYS